MKTYEEKYKKALEWMKEVYPTLQGAAKEDAEYYFPELCESEDEKIRQLLLRFVKYDMSDNYSDDFTPADCVAWLEKQGKNNMGISEATKKKLEDNLNKALEKETPESWNEFLEKQGEQNLANSAKTCKDEQKPILDVEIPFGAKDSELQEVSYSTPNGYHAEIEGNNVIIKKGEQKPAWSEEDEKMFEHIIAKATLHFSSINYLDEEEINFLKSLKERYTWKPSGEQIEALEHFVRSVGESGYASPYNNNTKLLYSLLSDLKKLKE